MKKDLVRLKSLVKKKKRSVLNKIVDFFIQSNYEAYLVGGIIRDKLLHRSTRDIDISVAGDAVEAGHMFNKLLKGRIEAHKEFRTISIFKDDIRIDIATSRKEIYPHPGSLPVVSPSNIYEDLSRRDFSVNAIALSISKDNVGEILDPYDGIGDIRRRLIRILHKKSFIDDPTRIFRALRYKNRLNFQLERSTEALLKEAVSKGMIQRISKQRLMNELKLIFTEKTYLKTLDDLLKYRIFFCDRKRLKNIARMGSLRYYYFLNLISAENFPLNRQELQIIKDLRNINTLKNILSRVKTNSTLFYTLNGVNKQVIMVMPRLYPELKPVILRYQSLRKIKPLINGEDLKRLQIKPGPAFKELLTKIYSLQLDGKIHNKRSALSFLKNG